MRYVDLGTALAHRYTLEAFPPVGNMVNRDCMQAGRGVQAADHQARRSVPSNPVLRLGVHAQHVDSGACQEGRRFPEPDAEIAGACDDIGNILQNCGHSV